MVCDDSDCRVAKNRRSDRASRLARAAFEFSIFGGGDVFQSGIIKPSNWDSKRREFHRRRAWAVRFPTNEGFLVVTNSGLFGYLTVPKSHIGREQLLYGT